MKKGYALPYRPIIGISGQHGAEDHQHSIRETYFDSVMRAGGLPVLLPRVADAETAQALLSHFDGLLLAGGVLLSQISIGDWRLSHARLIFLGCTVMILVAFAFLLKFCNQEQEERGRWQGEPGHGNAH